MLIITAIAASILGYLYFRLSFNVILFRRKFGIGLGDGNQEALQRAIRAQANLTEYAPIALILLACLELNNAPWWVTALLATTFVLGRLIHPMGMKDPTSSFGPRVKGMQLTLLSIIGLSIANVTLVVLHIVST